MPSLFEDLLLIDENEHLHQSRLLLLIGVIAGRNGNGTINGLSKLAKLDFLLRYPTCLERALKAISIPYEHVKVRDFERKSVESLMVMYRYGPWDFRYRRILNLLVGQGLVSIELNGRAFEIGITKLGMQTCSDLTMGPEFEIIVSRSRLIKRNFDMPNAKLSEFIYSTFPEISTLSIGSEISL